LDGLVLWGCRWRRALIRQRRCDSIGQRRGYLNILLENYIPHNHIYWISFPIFLHAMKQGVSSPLSCGLRGCTSLLGIALARINNRGTTDFGYHKPRRRDAESFRDNAAKRISMLAALTTAHPPSTLEPPVSSYLVEWRNDKRKAVGILGPPRISAGTRRDDSGGISSEAGVLRFRKNGREIR
jgi:hypothetical protein